MSQTVERKLVAIVSADVAGYSRLMSLDEVDTVRRLTESQEIIGDLVEKHRGRVVDNPGDNALLEFPSATDAVQCVITIQEAISEQNADVDPNRKMEYRIGVHLGEVMVEGDRIYGDGVNVAARLEAMADVGGVCVSKSIRDQVATKTGAWFVDLGEQTLKNIREPVHVFRIEMGKRSKQALISVSVAGLAALINQDKAGTFSALKAHRRAIDPLLHSHGGRLVQSGDDRFLYEYPSAIEAVTFGAEVQALMSKRNFIVPESRRMQFQLGIHLGRPSTKDVETTIRIESKAEPGGMAMSDLVYREIEHELTLDLKQTSTVVDSSNREMRLWNLAPPRPEVSPDESPDLGGPGALVVLPFERIGNDSDQDYLVDGITEDVTTALTTYREFHVIPRSAAFAYHDNPKTDREIARELDATYVLRGSVRVASNRVRVAAQLIDAESDHTLWAERFDRDLDDVFDLQDEIARSITLRIAPELLRGELDRSVARETDNPESWDLYQKGKWHYYRTTPEDYEIAEDLLQQAIDRDFKNGQSMGFLTFLLTMRIWRGWSEDVAGDYQRAIAMGERAVSLDSADWRSHAALAVCYAFTGQHDRGLEQANLALPWYPAAVGLASWLAGDLERAIDYFTRAIRLSPGDPDNYHWRTALAHAYFMDGNYQAALRWAEQAIQGLPDYVQALAILAASLAEMERTEEARHYMDEFLEQLPGMTAVRYRRSFRFKNDSHVDKYMEGLVKAGLPTESDAQAASPRAAWIAVMPFDNMSDDPQQDFFGDGVAEDIITGLSAFRSLRVIARTSSFQYRDSRLSAREIGKELGVRFILEGSVRTAGDRIRVNSQLFEAADGHHVWAERHDEQLEDIFDLQDRITNSIVAAIDPAIRQEEAHRISRSRPDTLDAWEHVQKGWYEHFLYKPDANRRARSQFEAAMALDPTYAQAHAGLSWTHSLDVWLRWSENDPYSQRIASDEANRAVELDPRDAVSHLAISLVNYTLGRLEMVLRAAGDALALNPSLASAHMMVGLGHVHDGNPKEGIEYLNRALELSPRDPLLFLFHGAKASAHFFLREYEEAIDSASQAIRNKYGYLGGRVIRACSLVEQGEMRSARNEIEAILEIAPDFTAERLDQYLVADPADKDRVIDALAKAGVNR